MLMPKDFFEFLKDNGINFFTGVPDSTLKHLCSYIEDHGKNHIIAVNEGAAIGLAIGHHLASDKIPLVYMQNSGIGNAINPLLSLASPEIYATPMLIIIGWRGETGTEDEPQHTHQGRVLLSMLSIMELDYEVLPIEFEHAKMATTTILEKIKSGKKPGVLVVRKDSFKPYKLLGEKTNQYSLSREQSIEQIIRSAPENSVFIASTGHIGRELYEVRDRHGLSHKQDFLTIGGMGHASQIGLAIAKEKPKKQVIILDGDGSALMHMGSLAINGQSGLKNFKHIILNNSAHLSVGGQPTCAHDISFSDIASACGYEKTDSIEDEKELAQMCKSMFALSGPLLFDIKINTEVRSNLGRPKLSPIEQKDDFKKNL